MTAPRLAWGLLGVWVALAVLAAYYSIRSKEEFEGLFMLGLTVFAVVGAVVASRQPRNPIGWILQAVVLFSALTSVLIGYTSTADEPAEVAVWLDDWIADVWIGLVAVGIPLLFPDGHLPSPRWRPAAWLATGLFTLGIAGRALGDRVLDTEAPGTWENPYALPGVAGDVMADIASVSVVFYGVPALIGVAGLVVRMRRSHGVERQQLKWFAYVGLLLMAALILSAISLIGHGFYFVGVIGWSSFLALVTFGLPLAIGAAILRHRLYDIDVVINRTLVYGALTATLGVTYLALVLLIGLTLGTSNLAIAVSTLAVAALFRPARARIQARGRPALLPPPLRRGADAGGVRRAAPRRARPRCARRRPARRGARHGAARPRLAVAEERPVRRLAWALSAITVALAAGTAAFAIVDDGTGLPAADGGEVEAVGELMFAVMVVAFGGLGALLASRRPRNPIGWILVVSALSLSVSRHRVAGWYVHGFYADPGSQPPPDLLLWVAQLDLGLRASRR